MLTNDGMTLFSTMFIQYWTILPTFLWIGVTVSCMLCSVVFTNPSVEFKKRIVFNYIIGIRARARQGGIN